MIALCDFDKTDYERLIQWVDSEEALMQFAGPAFSFPLTGVQLDESIADKNRTAFTVMNLDTQAIIGHAEIYVAENSAYLSRILIGDVFFRGKGIGKEMVECLLEYVFLTLMQSAAELNVFDWNTSAVSCYLKSGFKINPAKKVARKVSGKTWIALNMTLTKEEWQQRKMLDEQ